MPVAANFLQKQRKQRERRFAKAHGASLASRSAPGGWSIWQSGRDPVHHGDRVPDPGPNEQRVQIAAAAQLVGIAGGLVFGLTPVFVQHQVAVRHRVP
jgi:hypothetical protein